MSEGAAQGRRSYGRWLLWFWTGLCAFAGIALASFFLSGSLPGQGPIWVIAIVVAAVTAALGLWAIRARNVGLGSGMLVGYAVATAFSAGQCTFWVPPGYAALSGAIIYLLVIGVAFLVAIVVSVVEAYRARTRGR